MTNFLRPYFLKLCLTVGCAVALHHTAKAQTETDALMIPKNYFCAAGTYSYSDWTKYWEGTFKRNNYNIGTLSVNTYTLAGNYGITNKLDFLFAVPYVTTNASAGTLKGQKGFQDMSLSLKWLALGTEIGKGIFTLHAIGIVSLPISNYEPDLLPVSIGLHSKTGSARALANYQTGRFFVAGSGEFIYRDDVTLNQDAYYTTREIYSNKVYMPNVASYLFSTGYRSLLLNVEGVVTQTNTLGGFDIRKNDMPFPSNKMNMTTVGGLIKYSFESTTGLELTLGGNYAVNGRNVGQAATFYGAVYYVFDFSKKDKK